MPETHQPTTTDLRGAVPGYRVDDLVVDTGCARVTRSGTEIPLPKLSFDLLLALIEAAPRIVNTDELMERDRAQAQRNACSICCASSYA